MPNGGKRPGAGRPKGARNKRTEEAQAAAARTAEAIAEVIPQAFEGDAHALLMMVYKDPSLPIDVRLDAAGKAIKFEKPALSSVEAKVENTVRDMSDDELKGRIADRLRKVAPILGWNVQ